jgi:AraC-like DNA-binding protein
MIAESLPDAPDGQVRRDYRRSKHRFLAAARDLLDERGPTVTLYEIATRARVDARTEATDPLDVFLAQRLQEILELVAASSDPPPASECQSEWLADLRGTLPARLADRTTSLSEVSRALAISPRTLQRRLANAGTSWRDEVDAARRELAVELARAGESRKTIARQVGYSDTRGLRRALRRWTDDVRPARSLEQAHGEQRRGE